GMKIACEISVTTDYMQEFHNIEKCLTAGCIKIIVCSPDRKKLDKIRAYTMERLESSEYERIFYFEPETLFAYFDERVAQQTVKEGRVKGYRVKVQYNAGDEEEKRNKRESVAHVILNSMRRLKQPKGQ
ncbi:MAG: hypothetical protein Q7R79_00775, partial [bacterium]|nr:hypothetical protein [bacterium]